MADDEDIAALVVDNGSGMCKGTFVMLLLLDKFECRALVASTTEKPSPHGGVVLK
jgi:hypothetical protein